MEKLAEDLKKREIEIKLERMEQMEAQLAEMNRRDRDYDLVDEALTNLRKGGLVKMNASGILEPVESWQEHCDILRQREEEKK